MTTKVGEETVTEIYEKSTAKQANEEETKKYIKVLDKAVVLEVYFGNIEDGNFINFPKQSLDKIFKLMPEKKKYGVGYVTFCLTTEEIQMSETRQKMMKQLKSNKGGMRKMMKNMNMDDLKNFKI